MAEAVRVRTRTNPFVRHFRTRQDILLALALGGLVALLMNSMAMEAALVSSIIGAFLILAMVDTRAAVLSLLLVRSLMDVTATVPLVSAAGSSQVNAAGMMSFIAITVAVAHIALTHLDVHRVPLAKPSMVFLGITLVGVVIAPDPNTALQDWIRTLSAFLIYVLLVDVIRTRRDIQWLIQVMLASSVVPIIVGVQQFLTDSGNKDTPGLNRIYGTFTHPAAFSMFLAQIFPLALVMFLHTRSRVARVALLLLVPAFFFSIYEAQTRGAWIGVMAAVVVFMASRVRWSLVLVPLMCGALFFGVPSVRARFDEATSSSGSVLWRQEQWSTAIGIASPARLVTIGEGFDAVSVRTGNLTHNEYIRLLVETGLAGLITMIVLYRNLFLMALAAYRKAATPFDRDLMLAFLMTFAARVIIALSDNILVYPVLEWYFWAFAALVVATSGIYRPARIGRRPLETPVERQAA
jgi:putative inorganic carbon (HCO3(-)) transporter